MGKRLSFFYAILSIAFIIGLCIYTGFRLQDIRRENTRRVSSGFEQLRYVIETSYLKESSFSTEAFSKSMGQAFALDPDLDILVIYSYDTGVQYLRTRDSGFLGNPAADFSTIKGTPRFSYSPFFRTQVSKAVNVPGRSSFIIGGVYKIIRDGELFRELRTTLIVLCVFAGVTSILLFLFVVFGRKEEASFEEEEKEAAAASPASSQPVSITLTQPPSPPPQPQRVAITLNQTPPVSPPPPPQPVAFNLTMNQQPQNGGAGQFGAAAEGAYPSVSAPEDWRDTLEKRLSLEVEKSAYNEEDLCLLLVRVPGLSGNTEDYRRLGREIETRLSFVDLTFPYPPDGYAVILPNAGLEQSIGNLKNFLKTLSRFFQAYSPPLCGLTARNTRLVEGTRLLVEAEEALRRTGPGEDSRIVGFRPDPGKYREYISGQTAGK
ncbi:MAG: hypothetical protein LBC67_05910 [Spirochaetales bacterium]|jgi:hypothetical protein|nr:hypothetical protein [Spirochaetales bacterium]